MDEGGVDLGCLRFVFARAGLHELSIAAGRVASVLAIGQLAYQGSGVLVVSSLFSSDSITSTAMAGGSLRAREGLATLLLPVIE